MLPSGPTVRPSALLCTFCVTSGSTASTSTGPRSHAPTEVAVRIPIAAPSAAMPILNRDMRNPPFGFCNDHIIYGCAATISLRKRVWKPPHGGFQSTPVQGWRTRCNARTGSTCGLFGRRRSYLLERELAQLKRIADAGLRDRKDRLGDDFGERIGPVRQFQDTQTILIRGNDRGNVFRHECRMLQQAVNRHGGRSNRRIE